MKFFTFIIFNLLFLNVSALAAVDVTCRRDSCLNNGWIARDLRTGLNSHFICEAGDCRDFGWREHINGRINSVTRCLGHGCWETGWTTSAAFGPNHSTTYCLRNQEGIASCLTEGWETQYSNGMWSTTRCTNGSCEVNGWETIVAGRVPEIVRCKLNSCFIYGWNLYQ